MKDANANTAYEPSPYTPIVKDLKDWTLNAQTLKRWDADHGRGELS